MQSLKHLESFHCKEEAKLEAKDVVTSIVKKIDIEYQDDIQDMAIEILKKLEPNGLDEYKNVIKDQLDKVNDNIKKKVFSNICKTLETCDVDSIQQARDFKQEKKIIDKMEEAKNKTSKEIKQRNEIKDKINVLEKEKEELESKKQKLEEEPNPSPGIKEEIEEINKTISEKTKNLAKSKADKIKIENKIQKDFETATGMTSEARILEKTLKDMELYSKLRNWVETLIEQKKGEESVSDIDEKVDKIMKKILNHMAKFYKLNTGDVDKV